MSLAGGTKLGPYEIVAPLGAGGMGVVYRARDTRLKRTVAIKVLPERAANSPELHQRFEREARVVASLSHPHICALYDIGSDRGVDFLVMEFLEGQTLAERLRRGALPLNQVLRFAIEIADALENAHRAGITHRDLKPANIMLTESGAKLLDFGLAKLRVAEATSGASKLSTVGQRPDDLTNAGAILGTWQYMSPEQLEGRVVDSRSDVFAFGAVIHEMATGCKPFQGASHASVIAAILDSDPPPVSAYAPNAPPALDRLVGKCLAKDPNHRWQTSRDLLDELKWIAHQNDGREVRVRRRMPVWWSGLGRFRRRAAIVSVLAAVVAGLAAWAWIYRPHRPQGLEQITRTAGETNVFPRWSADGMFIDFFQIKPAVSFRRLAVAGGEPREIGPWSSESGAALDPAGQRVVYRQQVGEPITATVVHELATKRETPLPVSIWGARWSRDGRAIIGTEDRRSADGGVHQNVVECAIDAACRVLTHGHRAVLSGDDSRVFFLRSVAGQSTDRELWSVDRDGKSEQLLGRLGPFVVTEVHFDVSPRNQVVWVRVQTNAHKLWLADLK